MSLSIPGLPEGVVCVRIGLADPTEFELTRNSAGLEEITKGGRVDSLNQIVVEPSEGFEFSFDIRRLTFRPVKKLVRPMDVTAAVKFTVTNQVQFDLVQDRLAALKNVPGFVEMK
jgi:hypothetical protein